LVLPRPTLGACAAPWDRGGLRVFSPFGGAGADAAFLFRMLEFSIAGGGPSGTRTGTASRDTCLVACSSWSANSFTLPLRKTLYRRLGKRPTSAMARGHNARHLISYARRRGHTDPPSAFRSRRSYDRVRRLRRTRAWMRFWNTNADDPSFVVSPVSPASHVVRRTDNRETIKIRTYVVRGTVDRGVVNLATFRENGAQRNVSAVRYCNGPIQLKGTVSRQDTSHHDRVG
jgi:hypothetical protein